MSDAEVDAKVAEILGKPKEVSEEAGDDDDESSPATLYDAGWRAYDLAIVLVPEDYSIDLRIRLHDAQIAVFYGGDSDPDELPFFAVNLSVLRERGTSREAIRNVVSQMATLDSKDLNAVVDALWWVRNHYQPLRAALGN